MVNSISTFRAIILLVEDEKMVLEATSELLTTLGYKVIKAIDGRQAIEIYKNRHHEIDLIILDLLMPVMDGKEAFNHLKQIHPNAKIILSTATGVDGELMKHFGYNPSGYLRKPYIPRELINEIERVLSLD